MSDTMCMHEWQRHPFVLPVFRVSIPCLCFCHCPSPSVRLSHESFVQRARTQRTPHKFHPACTTHTQHTYCIQTLHTSRHMAHVPLRVDRYTSHVIFLMQFAHLITCISHCMAQDEPPNVSVCALHSIFMPSMMCA